MKIVYSVFLTVSIGVFLSKFGLKRFEPWEQVTIWSDGGVPPFALVGHAHFYRYLVAYPGFLLEQQLPNFGFSIYITAFIGVSVGVWCKFVRYVSCAAPRVIDWVIFLTPFIFMNGRGAIAWTSWILIVWQTVRITDGKLNPVINPLVLSFAFLLASVTTGVFITVVLTWAMMLTYFFIKVFPELPSRKWYSLPGFALVSILVKDFFFISIEKNLEFFGTGMEGLVELAGHGAGDLVSRYKVESAFIFVLGSTLLSTYAWLTRYRFGALLFIKLVPIFGGVFGYTVLTLALPVIFVRSKGLILRRTKSKSFPLQRKE